MSVFSKLLFLIGIFSGPSGEIGRHIGLKIRCFVNSERADSTSARGTNEHAASETFYVLEPYFSCLERYTLVTQNNKRLYHLCNEN